MTLAGYGASAPAWMQGTALEQIYLDTWIDTGDAQLALEAVRQSPAYDEVLAGNRRDDGSLRYDETTYFGIVETYEDVLLSIDVNPDLFRSKFPDMIAGLVSPNEFATRIDSVYERVITQSQQVKDFYANEVGIDMTDSAIIASVLDPDLGQAILNRTIAISEVGGNAAARGFNVGGDLAAELVNFGVDTRGEAQGLFSQAQSLVPTLSVLAQRHADPDDDFDIAEFASASVFGDPEQRRRMRRLMAQERTSFGPDRGLTISQNQSGSLTGLADR